MTILFIIVLFLVRVRILSLLLRMRTEKSYISPFARGFRYLNKLFLSRKTNGIGESIITNIPTDSRQIGQSKSKSKWSTKYILRNGFRRFRELL
jgi:hypothetical protein